MRTVLCSLLLAAGLCAANFVHAQDPAQIPLETALSDLAARSGLQLAYRTEVTRGMMVKPPPAGLKPQEELRALLKGTGLEAQKINETTMTIRRAGSAPSARSSDDSGELRLARVQEEERRESTATAAQNVPPAEEMSKGVPEILVKGNRSLNTDIKRTEDAPQPYVIFDSREIQRSQAVNLEDFLRTRLPMNTASSTRAQSAASAMSTSSINLRGLGDNQTLILVDGRRMPGFSASGQLAQTDINGIPLAAIERVEVLPSTAGGIYGGSATGGVINIILRRDYQGVEARATYGNTFDTDAGSMQFDLNGGFSLEGGRTQVTVAASRSTANTLMAGDRDFSARGIALQLKNNPAAITGLSSPPPGGTVNIRSLGGDLTLDTVYGGASLGSTITHLPYGYAGPASDNGAALVANASQYNLDMPAGPYGRQHGLVTAPTVESATLNVRREFSSRIEAFLDMSTMGNIGHSYNAIVPDLVANLPADAPNNPFGQNIAVRLPIPNILFGREGESTALRGTAGIITRFAGNWMAEVDYGWSRSRYKVVGVGSAVDTVGSCVLSRGVAANVDPDGPGPLTPCNLLMANNAGDMRPALNALQEGNAFPLDFSPYLMPADYSVQGPADTTMRDVTLRMSGPLVELPAGPLSLSVLAERRQEDVKDSFNTSLNTARVPTSTYYPGRSQDVDSLYVESRVPLISARSALPWARELELQASVRRDKYTTRGTQTLSLSAVPATPLEYTTNELVSTDYTVGLRYAPVRDMALRASFGTGFLPPSMRQVGTRETITTYSAGASDPKRGFEESARTLHVISGGGPGLKPETSESLSVGFILTPRFAPGLRLSIDYTKIDKVDEIRPSPGLGFFLANEDQLPGRVFRGEKLPGDPATWAGPITGYNNTVINIASTSLEAYDVQANYTFETQRAGDFSFYALATWQPRYRNQLLPGNPVIDQIGYSGDPLEWRGNAGLDWSKGSWTVSWNAQYYDHYLAYSPGSGSTAAAVAASLQANRDRAILNQGSATIPHQLYHDLIASYRFDGGAAFFHGLLADSEISVGIQNLFDKSPPILALTDPGSAGYSTYGDARLRRYTLSLRKSFGN